MISLRIMVLLLIYQRLISKLIIQKMTDEIIKINQKD